jgi:hypothetical protein
MGIRKRSAAEPQPNTSCRGWACPALRWVAIDNEGDGKPPPYIERIMLAKKIRNYGLALQDGRFANRPLRIPQPYKL